MSPLGADLAQALEGGHLSISGDDENLFVYTDTAAAGGERARRDPLRARTPRDHGDDEWGGALARRRGALGQRAVGRGLGGRGRAEGLRALGGSRHVPVAARGDEARAAARGRGLPADPPVEAPHHRHGIPRGRRRSRRPPATARSSRAGRSCGKRRSTPRSFARSCSSAEAFAMIPDDLDPLEQHLLAAFETLTPPEGAASRGRPPGRGALAGADREPALRSRGALAPEGEALLLLDRIGRAREQCGGRRSPCARRIPRCCTTAPARSISPARGRRAGTASPT